MNIYLACALSFVGGFFVAMAVIQWVAVEADHVIGGSLNDEEEEE